DVHAGPILTGHGRRLRRPGGLCRRLRCCGRCQLPAQGHQILSAMRGVAIGAAVAALITVACSDDSARSGSSTPASSGVTTTTTAAPTTTAAATTTVAATTTPPSTAPRSPAWTTFGGAADR